MIIRIRHGTVFSRHPRINLRHPSPALLILYNPNMSTRDCNHHCDYAIVGGGCFGASTALALKGEWPDARVVWFEGSATHTASKDISKIIRTPYSDKDYVAFAEQAMRMWKEVVPYCNFIMGASDRQKQ